MSDAPRSCFAATPPGIEGLTARELEGLGIVPTGTEPGGVSFQATAAQLYAVNLQVRTANRIVVRLAEFTARAFYELERKAKRVPWGEVVAPGKPIRFRVTSKKSRLYHADGIAERLGGVAAMGVEEDDDDVTGVAQLFIVRVFRDVVTISADSSGDLLHRRGYRLATAKAPLRETLAAAMLLGAEYDGSTALLDPFCGSGTIPIEAALLARRIPPGMNRGFAFERWPSFDPDAWRAVKQHAEAGILPRAPSVIHGSDRDAGAITAAHANTERAGVAEDLVFVRAPLSKCAPPPGPGLLVTNPPYGVRVGEGADLRNLYARLGALVRERCAGWQVALLSADRKLEAALGLPLDVVWRSSNGGIRVRLMGSAAVRQSGGKRPSTL